MTIAYELDDLKKKLQKSLIKEIRKKKKRKKVVQWVVNLIESGELSLDPDAIYSKMQEEKNEDKRLALQHLYLILNERKYTSPLAKADNQELDVAISSHVKNHLSDAETIIVSDSSVPSLPPSEEESKKRNIIGRVALTPYSPATPTQFYFWIKDDPSIHVEPGTLITVEDSGLKVVGIVEDVKAMSEVPNTMSEFYGWGYGNPEEIIATHRPVIREALAKVITRSDGRSEPLIRKHPVYLADRNEIIEAYSANINDEDRFLVGFTKDANNNFVPVYADFDYIFGYNGAHINISGASGLAAKTSYALFLILSALAYSKKYPKKGVAIVAFNVKERDLLEITKFKEKFSDLTEVVKILNSNKRLKTSAQLWKEAGNEGINPFELLNDKNIKIYEPGKDFKFGFMDLIELGEGTIDLLRLLFDKEDLNENFEALLYAILNEYGTKDKVFSFNDIVKDLRSKLSQKTSNQQKSTRYSYQYIFIGGIPIHKATVGKFLRRIEVVLRQLDKIIDAHQPRVGKYIKLGADLRAGNMIVINIEPLPDRGKRLVFLSVLKILNKILEAKKEGEKEIELFGDHYDLDEFPSRIVVFVDELNKFAPRGKEYSSIKAPIIDIAARGRSIGLSLIGAQQMASQVDQEILANCSTFVVGRSHPIEISGKAYDWLKGGLRERVTFLKQGELIMYHAIHSAPVLIYFPIPLHRIPQHQHGKRESHES